MSLSNNLTELRKHNIDVSQAHCVLALDELGGRATKIELAVRLGYTDKLAINFSRLCNQGILTSFETALTPNEGGAHCRGYTHGDQGIKLLTQLKKILNV